MALFKSQVVSDFTTDSGNILQNALVYVYNEDKTELATIYSDEEMTIEASNPTQTGSDGFYSFYIETGVYSIEINQVNSVQSIDGVEIFSKEDYEYEFLEEAPVGTVMLFEDAPNDKWMSAEGGVVSSTDYPDAVYASSSKVMANPTGFYGLGSDLLRETGGAFDVSPEFIIAKKSLDESIILFQPNFETSKFVLSTDSGATFNVVDLVCSFDSNNFAGFTTDRFYTKKGLIAVSTGGCIVRLTKDGTSLKQTLLTFSNIKQVDVGQFIEMDSNVEFSRAYTESDWNDKCLSFNILAIVGANNTEYNKKLEIFDLDGTFGIESNYIDMFEERTASNISSSGFDNKKSIFSYSDLSAGDFGDESASGVIFERQYYNFYISRYDPDSQSNSIYIIARGNNYSLDLYTLEADINDSTAPNIAYGEPGLFSSTGVREPGSREFGTYGSFNRQTAMLGNIGEANNRRFAYCINAYSTVMELQALEDANNTSVALQMDSYISGLCFLSNETTLDPIILNTNFFQDDDIEMSYPEDLEGEGLWRGAIRSSKNKMIYLCSDDGTQVQVIKETYDEGVSIYIEPVETDIYKYKFYRKII